MYAFLDLLNKAKNVEITRSAKAAVRIPFAVADLGLVIGNKFLTLPFDIGKSAFDSLADSLGDHFADGSDNRDLLLLLIMGEKEIQPDRTVTLTGTIEDQGLFFGRAGSHRLQVTLNKDNRTLPLSINIRSKDIRFIDLNEYIGKRVTVRARFSAEKRLGMCCNLGYLLMVENINLAPQTQEQGGK
ncbi:MAG: hypothetical protein HYW85_04030 [Deltaproteobacteria bacterium]|nr:hypothetical protein [Deltaproteobacteria bacterium]